MSRRGCQEVSACVSVALIPRTTNRDVVKVDFSVPWTLCVVSFVDDWGDAEGVGGWDEDA